MEENKALEEVKAGGELALEAFVEKAFQPCADEVVQKLKDLIPGEAYDGVADLLGASIGPVLKKAMLAQIEKISDKV